jgi:glycosyltransferase involved in cell wall biosynthesis
LRHIDRERVHFDFLVRTEEPGAYDNEIRALGSRIFICNHRPSLMRYRRKLFKIFKDNGPYDVFHSHCNEFSGVVLPVARAAGIPIRIAHMHSGIVSLPPPLWRRIWYYHLRRILRRDATHGFYNSKESAVALFGQSYRSDPRWRYVVCGIDFSRFERAPCPEAMRAKLGIPSGALVVANVSRFAEQKNHRFIVDIASEIEKREPRMVLLLIGKGPLRGAILEKIMASKLRSNTIVLDQRPDIPELMMGAMDVFLFPSNWEGQGMVVVEAQAAGLPVVMSDVIPEEVDIMRSLIHRLSLSQSASAWADAVLAARPTPGIRLDAREMLRRSQFSIFNNIKLLESIYTGE